MPTRATCHRSLPKQPAPSERERGTAAGRGYDRRWQRARLAFLRENPTCVECDKVGIVTAATVVDHVIPHRGDEGLFWDQSNWAAICAHHHAVKPGEGRFGRKGT